MGHIQTYKHIKETIMAMPDHFPIERFVLFYRTDGIYREKCKAKDVKRMFRVAEETITDHLRDGNSLQSVIDCAKEHMDDLHRLPPQQRNEMEWMLTGIILVKTNGMRYDDGHGLQLIYKSSCNSCVILT